MTQFRTATGMKKYIRTRIAAIDKANDPQERARRRQEAYEAAERARAEARLPGLRSAIELARHAVKLDVYKLTDAKLPLEAIDQWRTFLRRDCDKLNDLFNEARYFARIRPDLAKRFTALTRPAFDDPILPGEQVVTNRPITAGMLFDYSAERDRSFLPEPGTIWIPAGSVGTVDELYYRYSWGGICPRPVRVDFVEGFDDLHSYSVHPSWLSRVGGQS